MSNIPPPDKKTGRYKGKAPSRDEASQNLNKASGTMKDNKDRVALNFKVPPDFKKEFKLYALEHGIDMQDLVILAFDHYKASS